MKLRLLLPLFLLTILPAFAESGPHRIAVIDVNEVLSGSTAGKAVMGRLKATQDDRMAKADKLEAEVRKLEQDLGTRRLSLSETEIADRNRVIVEKRAALERFAKTVEQELGDLRDRELQKLEARLQPVIEAVAAEKNLDAVFSKSEAGLIFSSDRIDITADVTSRFNAVK